MDELKTKLLLYIYKRYRLELHEIESHFSKYDVTAIRRTLDNMYLYDDTITIDETPGIIHSVISITDEGRVQATNFKIRSYLTTKEIWKERLYGFISGILVTIISGAILSLIAG